jgi:hypothetical protein
MAISDSTRKFKDGVEAAKSIISQGKDYSRTDFTPAYIDACFTLWYKAGKPAANRLVGMLPNPVDFGIASGPVSLDYLRRWIHDDFRDRADRLDTEVGLQMEKRLIEDKVAMLEGHTQIANTMQQMALEYLTANRDKLNANAAVRMLVEGVRIERESRGIPRTLEKLGEKSDEELLKEIKNIMLMSTVDFLPPSEEDPDAL